MSVYDHRRNFIFIHIPRCAGTSIERVLDVQPGHTKIDTYYYFLKEYSKGLPSFEDVFKFTFVRNPIDRFVSGYFAQGLKAKNISDYIINEDWLDNIYFQPQWKFLSLPASDNLMSFTGRYESLEKDWKHISNILMIKEKLPHINKTKKKRYKISDRALGKLKSVYYNDYLMFGYEIG